MTKWTREKKVKKDRVLTYTEMYGRKYPKLETRKEGLGSSGSSRLASRLVSSLWLSL